MGKLSNLWGELKTCNNDDRKQVIKVEINRIEKWCIDNNITSIKTLTDFSKPFKPKKIYRFESSRDGGHQVPDGVRVGRDMCNMCRYNKHSYCGGGKPCMGMV